jgi:hypothetical protein
MQVYFNVVNGSETIRDETGVEVPDSHEAKAAALEVIQEMRSDVTEPRDWVGWRLDAVDPSGTRLFSIDLTDL